MCNHALFLIVRIFRSSKILVKINFNLNCITFHFGSYVHARIYSVSLYKAEYVKNAKELALLLLFTRQVDKSPYSHDLEVEDLN